MCRAYRDQISLILTRKIINSELTIKNKFKKLTIYGKAIIVKNIDYLINTYIVRAHAHTQKKR